LSVFPPALKQAHKSTTNLRKKGWIWIFIVATLLGVVLLLLSNSRFQRWALQKAVNSAGRQQGLFVRIDSMSFSLEQSCLKFYDVVLTDSMGNTLLSVDRADIDFQPRKILSGHLSFNAIRLIGARLHLWKETPEAELNLTQIPLFQPKGEKKPGIPLPRLNLQSVMLKDCRVVYDVLSEAPVSGWDKHHIDIKEINLRGNAVSEENRLKLNIDRLSCVGPEGFLIQDMDLTVGYDQRYLLIERFALSLPSSTVRLTPTLLYCPGLQPDSLALVEEMDLTASLSLRDFPQASRYYRLEEEEHRADLELQLAGNMRQWELRHLHFSLDDLVGLDGKATLDNILEPSRSAVSHWNEIWLRPEAADLYRQCHPSSSLHLPEFVYHLGRTSYTGDLSMDTARIGLNGRLSSDPGEMHVQADWRGHNKKEQSITGNISTEYFDLQQLLQSGATLGKTGLDMRINAVRQDGQSLRADVDAEIRHLDFNGYTYQNAGLQARIDNGGYYRAQLDMNDPNCLMKLDAVFEQNKTDRLQARLDLRHINLQQLNFLPADDGQSDLSFTLETDLQGDSPDNMQGILRIDSIDFFNRQTPCHADSLLLSLEPGLASIYSDVLRGELSGKFEFSELYNDIHEGVLSRYLPTVFSSRGRSEADNSYHFQLDMGNTRSWSAALQLPVTIPQAAHVEGYYDRLGDHVYLRAYTEEMLYQEMKLSQAELVVDNQGEERLFLTAASAIDNGGSTYRIALDADAAADSVRLGFSGEDMKSATKNRLNLRSSHLFSRNGAGSPLNVRSILNTLDIQMADSLWQTLPSCISWDGSKLRIGRFRMYHDDQLLYLDGSVSRDETDTLAVVLNRVSIDDLFRLKTARDVIKKKKQLLLGGVVTGDARIVSLLGKPQVNGDISVEKFSLNKAPLGDLQAKTRWNESKNGIELDASVSENGEWLGEVNGGFYLEKDSLYLGIDSHGIPLDFISYFSKPVVSLGGRAHGYIEVMGRLSHGSRIALLGTALVEQGEVRIDMLKTSYSFSDTVFMTPTSIRLNKVELTDNENNQAVFNGELTHSNFKNLNFDFRLSFDHFKLMDIPASPSESLYGNVYASGTASMSGPEKDLQIDVKASTTEKTVFGLSLASPASDNDYAFIRFVDSHEKRTEVDGKISLGASSFSQPPKINSNLSIVLELDVTPAAELVLITSASSGDEMKARGEGRLRILYSTREDMQIFGQYVLESGKYKFSIQDVLSREFNIAQGSTVSFSGDLMSAEMEIDAGYTVFNVTLSDLLDEADLASLNLNRTSIPVTCTMNISGKIEQPTIELGLAFPSADEELRRRIMNVINTDEILNRQIVYLLLLGRFGAIENTSTASTTTSDNMTAVVAATLNTLSRQINRLIVQSLGDDNLSLDLKYRYDDMATGIGEWQVAMSSQMLDNRLIINGNIGSREDLINSNTQFIGDFDMEYKFSQSGRWRLKMFNRSNDSRYFKSAMTTQGMGVVYKETFNTLSELRQAYVERVVRQIAKSKGESDLKNSRK